ncbi:hypothetical protein [Bartonella choladocola]|uniref:hypothetical protein n=1 Tax=Bartonella TaxID=773 RepID=UPI00350ECAB7
MTGIWMRNNCANRHSMAGRPAYKPLVQADNRGGQFPILSGSFLLSEKMRVKKCLADCSDAFKRSIERQMPLLLKIAISFACFLNGELMLLILHCFIEG